MPWKLTFAIEVALASAAALCLFRGYIVPWVVISILVIAFSFRFGADWQTRIRESWQTRRSVFGRLVSLVVLVGAMIYVNQVGVERAITNPYFILVYWIWMVWSAWRFSKRAPSPSSSA